MSSSRSQFVRLPSTALTLVLVLIVWALLLAAVLVLHFWQDVSFGYLTRDPADVFEVPFYLGFLSLASILFWSAATTASLFAALALPGRASSLDMRRFLASSGLLTLFLTLDDAFLLHDRIFPEIGISEEIVFVGYGVVWLLYFLVFGRLILNTDYVILAIALLFMAASIVTDVFMPQGEAHYLVEDSAKLAGILCWLAYYSRVGLLAVQDQIVS